MLGLPGSTTEIPDIFDVLEGGEDEGTVRFLLGFNGEEATVNLLGGVDTFVGMDHVEKYVGDGINLNMTVPSQATAEYLPPPGENSGSNYIENININNNNNNDNNNTPPLGDNVSLIIIKWGCLTMFVTPHASLAMPPSDTVMLLKKEEV